VRRNYIRNTNIFYSFPQDPDDTGSIGSNMTGRTPRDGYEYAETGVKNSHSGPPSMEPIVNPLILTEHYDSSATNKLEDTPVGTAEYSRVLNDSLTSEETIDFENASVYDAPPTARGAVTPAKSVTFDPSAIYATVVKESRTKF